MLLGRLSLELVLETDMFSILFTKLDIVGAGSESDLKRNSETLRNNISNFHFYLQ